MGAWPGRIRATLHLTVYLQAEVYDEALQVEGLPTQADTLLQPLAN
jgi:hypothetical protein